jgi:hypothetical protein
MEIPLDAVGDRCSHVTDLIFVSDAKDAGQQGREE